jgi:hypothetical protein
MELSQSWVAASRSAAQEFTNIVGTPLFIKYSQDPCTGPYPKPDYSSPYQPILLSKIRFNFIRSPTTSYSPGPS